MCASLAEPLDSARIGDYARIGFRYYSANYSVLFRLFRCLKKNVFKKMHLKNLLEKTDTIADWSLSMIVPYLRYVGTFLYLSFTSALIIDDEMYCVY